MIKIEVDTGYTGSYARIYLITDTVRIELSNGELLTWMEAEEIANRLQDGVDKIRSFVQRRRPK